MRAIVGAPLAKLQGRATDRGKKWVELNASTLNSFPGAYGCQRLGFQIDTV